MHENWKEAKAKVWSCEDSGAQGTSLGVSCYTVIVSYIVDGTPYSAEFETTKVYVVGQTLRLLYDPQNPERNSLSFRWAVFRWMWIGVGVLAAILIAFAIFSHKK